LSFDCNGQKQLESVEIFILATAREPARELLRQALTSFARKVVLFSPQDGRMIVAQQFTAGKKELRNLKSVKRTAE
jgi:hypothetical protein